MIEGDCHGGPLAALLTRVQPELVLCIACPKVWELVAF